MVLVSGTKVVAQRRAFLTTASLLFAELPRFSGFAVRLSLVSGMQPAFTLVRGRRFAHTFSVRFLCRENLKKANAMSHL